MNEYWKNYLNHIEYINQIPYDDGTNIITDKQKEINCLLNIIIH